MVKNNDTLEMKEQSNASHKEALIRNLEKQIVATIWLQALGQLNEAILLSKLILVSDNLDSHGEQKIVVGNWVQAFGLIVEALGVSQELFTIDKEIILRGQKLAITGSFIQSFGAQLEGVGGIEVIQEEKTGVTQFVP